MSAKAGALAALIAGATCVWGVVLPRIARTPTVKARIERLEASAIDGDALVVSDLDGGLRRDVSDRVSRR